MLSARRVALSHRWPGVKELWPEVAPTGVWLALAVVSSVVLALTHSPVAPLPGVVTLLMLPGATVLSYFETRPASVAGRVILAVCLSMMTVMVVGGLASLLLPHLGIAQPLDAIPQSVIWFILAGLMLSVGAFKRRDPVTWIFEGVGIKNVYVGFACGVLVLFSILGVAQLNHTGNARLATFSAAIDVVVLIATAIGGWSRTGRWPLNSLLYCASLALLVSTSLRGGNLYGWDIHQEFGDAWGTAHAGVWVIPSDQDPYASMLSLTVLPAVLHSLAKLRLLAFFQLVVPAILALLPLAVFSTIRYVPRWVTSGRTIPRTGVALSVVVGLIVASVAFSSELVSITRQAMALTMLAALVMVVFDRTMLKRPAQIIVGLLIVAISFTHYTTSYLLAAVIVCSWSIGVVWSKGWFGTPRDRIEKHRHDVQSRKLIGVGLAAVSLVAALGWNLVITRNDALGAPVSALTAKGIGLSGSTNASNISTRKFERLLVSQFKMTDSWIVPERGSNSIRLVAAKTPSTPGVVPSAGGAWQELNYLAVESIWIMLALSLLYGVFRLGRRSYDYSADLVGLGVAGLCIGGFLRFSGTLAVFFDPERAAILTAILLAAPLTLFLDDLVTLFAKATVYWRRIVSGLGFAWLTILVAGATGISVLFFGGVAPGSLSGRDWNADEFTVSTPELATAVWLRKHLNSSDIVQSDYEGQIVLLAEPGSYHLVTEILPPVVDIGAYVYLSTPDLMDDMTEAQSGPYVSSFRSNLGFFNHHFYVIYSTGTTRVYH